MLAVILSLIATPALAKTGDPLLGLGAVLLDETFSNTAIYTRWNAGVSKYPDSFNTRTLWGNGEKQLYTGNGFAGGPEPVKVSYGIATITAKPFASPALSKVKADVTAYRARTATATLVTPDRVAALTYTSGLLASKQTVPAIGTLITCRMKLDGKPGFIPACWAYDNTLKIEFDVMEHMPAWTGADCIKSTAHSPWLPGGKAGITACLPKGTLANRWHDFGGLLTADGQAVIYIDGKEAGRFSVKGGGFQKANLSILVNLAAGWPSPVGVKPPWPQPAKGAIGRMQVDRVTARVVQ